MQKPVSSPRLRPSANSRSPRIARPGPLHAVRGSNPGAPIARKPLPKRAQPDFRDTGGTNRATSAAREDLPSVAVVPC